MPECIRYDSDSGPADRDHFFHALDLHGFACVKAQQLAAKHWALVDRGNKHVWQLQINAVYLPACHFSNRIVDPVHGSTNQFPLLRIFECDGRWNRQFGSRL